MRKQLQWCLVGAIVAGFAGEASAQYVSKFPTMWWDFNNSDGQSAQPAGNPNAFDGAIQPGAFSSDPTPLQVRQRNSPGGGIGPRSEFSPWIGGFANAGINAGSILSGNGLSGNIYNNSPVGNDSGGGGPTYVAATLPAPGGSYIANRHLASIEHYIGGPQGYSGNAYDVEGGKWTKYENIPGLGDPGGVPTSGENIVDPQYDTIVSELPSQGSYRDLLRVASTDVGGNPNASPSLAGNKISYALWLNVKEATSFVAPASYTSPTSFLFARGGDTGGGGNMGITIREATNNQNDGDGDATYAFQIRSDPAPIHQTVTEFEGDEWNHWVFTYDLSNSANGVQALANEARIYRNGVLVETVTNLGGEVPTADEFYLFANELRTERGHYWVDDVAVWGNYVLTPQDVALIYDVGLAEAVPEPSSIALFGVGLAALAAFRRKRNG